MSRLSGRAHRIIEKLEALYDRDHGGCDSNTCSMAKAWECGYSLIAIDLFSGSGAGSDEFYALMDKLPKETFRKAVDQEFKLFHKDPDCQSVECPGGCGAYIYNTEWMGDHICCDSCGKEFKNPENREAV